jgi:hypothetical protein
MASSQKTDNLNLNKWTAADKPKREDFIYDNEIIDEAVSGHMQDDGIHVTTAERTSWNSAAAKIPAYGYYTGDGATTRDISLGFQPAFMLVCQVDSVGWIYSIVNDFTRSYMAIASTEGGTPGLSLLADGFRVKTASISPADGMFYRMNENGKKYIYLAFK